MDVKIQSQILNEKLCFLFLSPLWFLKLKFDSIAKSGFYATLKGLKTFLIQNSSFEKVTYKIFTYAISFLEKMNMNMMKLSFIKSFNII